MEHLSRLEALKQTRPDFIALTWNLYNYNTQQIDDFELLRQELGSQPAILALQEVSQETLNYLHTQFPMKSMAVGVDFEVYTQPFERYYNILIVTHPQLFRRVDSFALPLHYPLEYAPSMRNQRIVESQEAVVQIMQYGGQNVLVANMHAGMALSARSRIEQFANLHQRLVAITEGMPMIIMGDFNPLGNPHANWWNWILTQVSYPHWSVADNHNEHEVQTQSRYWHEQGYYIALQDNLSTMIPHPTWDWFWAKYCEYLAYYHRLDNILYWDTDQNNPLLKMQKTAIGDLGRSDHAWVGCGFNRR